VTVSSQSRFLAASPLLPAESPVGVVEVRVRGAGALLAQQFADPVASASTATEPIGLRLAVADAEVAAFAQGGRLSLEQDAAGLSFVVRLPRSEGPR
jgi:C4-dicarboxylate-specific signal transduction histidine kinase